MQQYSLFIRLQMRFCYGKPKFVNTFESFSGKGFSSFSLRANPDFGSRLYVLHVRL